MIKVAICEDEKRFRETIRDMLIKMSIMLDFEIQTKDFVCAEDLLEQCKEMIPYNLIILDIELEACDGLTAARRLREIYEYEGQLVFLTSHAEFMQDSFAVGTNQYLVKPVAYTEFEKKIGPLVKSILTNNRKLTVELVTGGVHILSLKEILFIQAYPLGRKGGVIIHTTHETIEAFGKMADFQEKLEKVHFFRVHKQTIVNLEQIKTFDGEEVLTTCNQKIKVSRNKKKRLKEKLLAIL